ncbi:hypothetical protein HYT91_02670 [Candidatus Pacearchaeota archaeon]|nr:hypothetical protein [Candidatus Pacearchaeota archaeon]
MIINYFKTKLWGDCYVANENYMNIVSISKNDVCVFADDERIFSGPYKEIIISKNNFKKIEDFAEKNKRRKLTDILKIIHQDNKNILNPIKDPFVKIKGQFYFNEVSKLRDYFFHEKPILE